MNVKFHLPDFTTHFTLNLVFLSMLKSCPQYFREGVEIASVYGAFPPSLWNGGRVIGGKCDESFVRQAVEAFNSQGIPLRFTFTNPALKEEHLSDPFCNMVMKAADNGMNGVIVNSPLLEDYIRKEYPNYKITSSTCKRITDPEKTAAAFVQNPAVRYPDILYRTGDIGVKNADGDIVFQSRRDGPIKHMGYRIELGEIERALGGVPEIVEAICFYDAPHDRIVCAFSGEISQKELVFALSKRLPKYMIPNLYLSYEALPHNANGKIDRVKIRDSFNTSYGK